MNTSIVLNQELALVSREFDQYYNWACNINKQPWDPGGL